MNRFSAVGCCYWLTGLPGAGKTTLAEAVDHALRQEGIVSYVLDGDRVRQGLSRDLGFGRADRAENLRRIAEAATRIVDAGHVVLAAVISPYRADRLQARQCFAAGRFFEVFVDADVKTCIARDPKGLYGRARAGEIRDLTGLDAPYEHPQRPDLHIDTVGRTLTQGRDTILEHYGRLCAASVARCDASDGRANDERRANF